MTVGFLMATVAGRAADVPAPLNDFGEAAESAYDHVAAKDWKGAASDLKDTKAALEKMSKAKLATAGFAAELAKLSTALDAKSRLAAMSAANELTRLAAEAGRTFAPKLPTEILLLDYEGREVVIQAEQGDPVRIRTAIASIRASWDKVRPVAEAKRGSAKPVAAFSAAVAALEHNTEVGKVAGLAKTLLDRVDDLEELF